VWDIICGWWHHHSTNQVHGTVKAGVSESTEQGGSMMFDVEWLPNNVDPCFQTLSDSHKLKGDGFLQRPHDLPSQKSIPQSSKRLRPRTVWNWIQLPNPTTDIYTPEDYERQHYGKWKGCCIDPQGQPCCQHPRSVSPPLVAHAASRSRAARCCLNVLQEAKAFDWWRRAADGRTFLEWFCLIDECNLAN